MNLSATNCMRCVARGLCSSMSILKRSLNWNKPRTMRFLWPHWRERSGNRGVPPEPRAQFVSGAKQPDPLLIIECDGETAEAVDTDAAFFSDSEIERTAAFLAGLFLQRCELSFQFFIGWFGHRKILVRLQAATIIRKKGTRRAAWPPIPGGGRLGERLLRREPG